MKILNVIQCTNLGGMEQASLSLMLGLKKIGHSINVISLNPTGALGPLLKKKGIPVTGLPYLGRGGWRGVFLIRRLLCRSSADTLIMTGHHFFTMLALGGQFANRRILAVHFHHLNVKPIWQWRLIYWLACRRFHAITFPSDFVRLEAEALYPPVARIARTVRNPIVIPSLPTLSDRLKARNKLHVPRDSKIVGNAGWLIPRKRFDVFLHVAKKISEAVPNAIFLIAGDGDQRAELETLAIKLNIEHRVKWLGWQENLTSFYHCLDVMVFNSDFDAMGLAPLEAIVHGVPLVASVRAGGIKEIIDRDEYGYLLSTHDVEKLSSMAIFYLNNPDVARAVAMAGRKKIESVSNSKVISEEICSLFNENA